MCKSEGHGISEKLTLIALSDSHVRVLPAPCKSNNKVMSFNAVPLHIQYFLKYFLQWQCESNLKTTCSLLINNEEIIRNNSSVYTDSRNSKGRVEGARDNRPG